MWQRFAVCSVLCTCKCFIDRALVLYFISILNIQYNIINTQVCLLFGFAEHRQYNQFNAAGQYGQSQFNNGGGFIGGAQRTSMMARPSYHPYREREDEIGSNELLERDVVGPVLL